MITYCDVNGWFFYYLITVSTNYNDWPDWIHVCYKMRLTHDAKTRCKTEYVVVVYVTMMSYFQLLNIQPIILPIYWYYMNIKYEVINNHDILLGDMILCSQLSFLYLRTPCNDIYYDKWNKCDKSHKWSVINVIRNKNTGCGYIRKDFIRGMISVTHF